MPATPTQEVDLDAADLPEGTRLRRWYCGRCHIVDVVAPVGATAAARRRKWWRYRYCGRRYKTLTAIAREITGRPFVSGNTWFGLRRRRRGRRRS